MIEILLPVYNGEKYLAEQIESILKQTYENWILKIRNDGSLDNSQVVIDYFCRKYPNKIFQIVSLDKNIGLVQSLNLLIESEPHGDYIAFSDQDDVWFPDKLKISIDKLKDLEKHNPKIPIGVCSDSSCVDSNLNIISQSFFKSQKFQGNIIGNINKMLALNIVQGSTVLTNRIAVDFYSPFPNFLNVHDMWLSVIISHYGQMTYVKTQTMLYRQHSNNVLGQLNIGFRYYVNRAKSTFKTLKLIRKIQKSLEFKTNLVLILIYKLQFACKRIL